jgi:hypothetical protein
MNSDNGFDLDSHLERELHRQVGSISGPRPFASQSAYHAAFMKASRTGLRSRLASVASSRVAAGLAVAALAVGGGSLAAAAATGSSDPAVWGKTVTAAVEQCKDQLGSGIHGIGECVSQVAKQKGAEARAAHSQGGSAKDHPNGAPAAKSNGNANGNANANGNGNTNGHPGGGPPSTTPAGPKPKHSGGTPPTPPGLTR